jgi:hypothetical protein
MYGKQIYDLENQKKMAVNNEDFDQAMDLKRVVDKMKANLKTIINSNINNNFTDFENQIVGNVDDYESNMNDVISRSMIETGVTPNDRTMILTTCTRLGSDNDPYNRISLYTKVNPIYEKTMNNSRSL